MDRDKDKAQKKENSGPTVSTNEIMEFIKKHSQGNVVAFAAIIYTLDGEDVTSYMKASTPDGNDISQFLVDSSKIMKQEGVEAKVPPKKQMH